MQSFDLVNNYAIIIEKFTRLLYDTLNKNQIKISQLKNFKQIGGGINCKNLGTIGFGQVIVSKCESINKGIECVAHLSLGSNPEYVSVFKGINFKGCQIKNDFVMTKNQQVFDLDCFDKRQNTECILTRPNNCTSSVMRQDIKAIRTHCNLIRENTKLQRGHKTLILSDLTYQEYSDLRQLFFHLPENYTIPVMLTSNTLPMQSINIFQSKNRLSEVQVSLPKLNFAEELLCPKSIVTVKNSQNYFFQYLISLGNSLGIAFLVLSTYLIKTYCKCRRQIVTNNRDNMTDNQQDMLNLLTIMTRPTRPIQHNP